MKQVVIATKNKGKLQEYQAALGQLGWEVVPVDAVTSVPEPEETGATFMENALLKARYYGAACGLPALADDSGLMVDALDGAPGVYSARYAGEHGDTPANNAKLVAEMRKHPDAAPTARFVCAIACVHPDGTVYTAEGTCEGEIQLEPAGTHGFGYDPHFYVPAYQATMAELPMEIKNQISHRGQALAKLVAQWDA